MQNQFCSLPRQPRNYLRSPQLSFNNPEVGSPNFSHQSQTPPKPFIYDTSLPRNGAPPFQNFSPSLNPSGSLNPQFESDQASLAGNDLNPSFNYAASPGSVRFNQVPSNQSYQSGLHGLQGLSGCRNITPSTDTSHSSGLASPRLHDNFDIRTSTPKPMKLIENKSPQNQYGYGSSNLNLYSSLGRNSIGSQVAPNSYSMGVNPVSHSMGNPGSHSNQKSFAPDPNPPSLVASPIRTSFTPSLLPPSTRVEAVYDSYQIPAVLDIHKYPNRHLAADKVTQSPYNVRKN